MRRCSLPPACGISRKTARCGWSWPNRNRGRFGADDPRISRPAIRRELRALGADIVPLHSKAFGARYPQGNKLEALALLPKGEPFAFFDTDTLITGPISDVVAGPPTASQLVEPTWPREPLYGPSLADIWGALYDRFGLDMAPTLDTRFGADDWRRYMYFNAGWFTGTCPRCMGARLLDYAAQIERDPPPDLAHANPVPVAGPDRAALGDCSRGWRAARHRAGRPEIAALPRLARGLRLWVRPRGRGAGNGHARAASVGHIQPACRVPAHDLQGKRPGFAPDHGRAPQTPDILGAQKKRSWMRGIGCDDRVD